MPIKIDEEYRVKKFRRSSVDMILNQKNHISRSNNYLHQQKSSKKQISNRAVVKVTSGSKGYQEMSNHIDYISRNGKVELYTADNRILLGKKQTIEAKREMGLQNEKLLSSNDGLSTTKQTYNIVFSLKNFNHLSEKVLIDAVNNTIKKKYPNNYFVYALHKDTEHPHIHMCLNKMDRELQKNINMDKKSLQEIKHLFSKELIKNNVQVELEPQKISSQDKDTRNIQKKKPTGVFELVAHGKAPYLHDPKNKESYFVRYKTSKNQIVEIWGKNLERAIKESKAEIGNDIKLKKKFKEGEKIANWEISIYQNEKQKDFTEWLKKTQLKLEQRKKLAKDSQIEK